MDFGKRFAKAILKTQKLREESYDHGKADRHKGDIYFDYSTCYKLSMAEAARKAVRETGFDIRMNQPIYLLCEYTWNDIQAWAEEILKS